MTNYFDRRRPRQNSETPDGVSPKTRYLYCATTNRYISVHPFFMCLASSPGSASQLSRILQTVQEQPTVHHLFCETPAITFCIMLSSFIYLFIKYSCSICVHLFGALAKVVRLFKASLQKFQSSKISYQTFFDIFRRNALAFRSIGIGFQCSFARSTRNQLLEYIEDRLT